MAIQQMSDAFWIVWNPKSARGPEFRHTTVTSARDEAQRLARENPGIEFIVLQSIDGYEMSAMHRTTYTDQPF